MSTVDKIAGLKEILALDPKNSFARYGIAVELANRGETDAAISEFDQLLAIDPDYTAATSWLPKHLQTWPDRRGDRAPQGRNLLRRTLRQPACPQ